MGQGSEITWPVVTPEFAPAVAIQIGRFDNDQREAMGGDQLVAADVVESALLTSMHSGDGHSLGLVEVGQRFVVLDLAIFDDQLELGPVRVDGQPPATGLWSTCLVFIRGGRSSRPATAPAASELVNSDMGGRRAPAYA